MVLLSKIITQYSIADLILLFLIVYTGVITFNNRLHRYEVGI